MTDPKFVLDEGSSEVIFALDIGTRNVVGTLAKKHHDIYTVLDYEIMPHPERSMFDGQIHDIDKVAMVIRQVKRNLELRNDMSLKKVAIAAAGRSLKTARVTVSMDLDFSKEISKETIDSLEMEGIQVAQEELAASSRKLEPKYYCVGYSVIHYYLDDALIMNPKGHRGNQMTAELIATFLPHIVVDSLYSAVSKADLEVLNMTLEPIAAINVAIPENLRLLNLALVDVGAGTSDIAITKEGAIASYGMVALAGDEITEVLAKEFLLDYNSAERLKIELSQKDMHEFTDVIGLPHLYSTSEIMEKIHPVVNNITEEIAKTIISYNDKAPSAVFCIGGGCQIPGFTESLARALGLQKERAVIKGTEHLEKLVFEGSALRGPEFITPIGIGVTAFKEKEHDFLQVSVNDNQIRLFNSKTLNVSDALVLVGFSARKLIAPRGPAIQYKLGGLPQVIYGEYGEPAKIYVNGIQASLDTKLKNKDAIFIEEAQEGKKRQLKISEVVKWDQRLVVNGSELTMFKSVEVNGKGCHLDQIIEEGDNIFLFYQDQLSYWVSQFGLTLASAAIKINGQPVYSDQTVKPGDQLIIEALKINQSAEEAFDINEAVEEEMIIEEVTSVEATAFKSLESAVFHLEKAPPRQLKETEITLKLHYNFIVNGKAIEVNNRNRPMMYVDIFDYINFDLKQAKGMLDLKLNGNRAKYTDEIKTGDVIEISWR